MLAGQILTLDDIDIKDKTVLLRVDINCPVESETKRIKDDTRIKRSIKTIEELNKKNAKLVILAHQGDPLDYQNFCSLKEHGAILKKYFKDKFRYIEDVTGPYAIKSVKNLNSGEILLLDNVRIHTEETIIFEKELKLTPAEQAETIVVRKLAPLADYYICDAFACVHRSEPTLVGFPEFLPSAAGRLFEEELNNLTQVRDEPERPCIFILGGAKILDAFKMMAAVLKSRSADKVLTTGLVAEIILKAKGYELGIQSETFLRKKNLLEFVDTAIKINHEYSDRIIFPEDLGVNQNGHREEISIENLPAEGIISDIGKKSIDTYTQIISQAKTIFMNGPAGIYENPLFALGTKSIWNEVANCQGFSVIGGGIQ